MHEESLPPFVERIRAFFTCQHDNAITCIRLSWSLACRQRKCSGAATIRRLREPRSTEVVGCNHSVKNRYSGAIFFSPEFTAHFHVSVVTTEQLSKI